MADPLSFLRRYNINKNEIIERGNQVIFEDVSFPKNVRTNYLARTNKKSKVKEYYTLECLLYFLKNIHLFHPDYCKQAAAANISAVRRPDRKELLKYLNGETATCASIDKSAPLVTPIEVKQIPNYEKEESAAKKRRIEETQVQKMGEPPNKTTAVGNVNNSVEPQINQESEYKCGMSIKLEYNDPDTEESTRLFNRREVKHELDEDETFLLSLNKDFKEIPKSFRNEAKFEISKIINKYKSMSHYSQRQ